MGSPTTVGDTCNSPHNRNTSVASCRKPYVGAMSGGADIFLTRDQFRDLVLARDGHACVICGARAADGAKLDVHHIMERRLFPDGGCYLNNGVTLCDDGERHHLQAEMTALTPDELRSAAGITTTLLPPGLDDELSYDKWGDAYLPGGRRSPGPLFYEEPVQKMLAQAGVLGEFEMRFKHPRTIHLPWSPNQGSDGDHIHTDLSGFVGREVVVTEKGDGENTSMTRDYIHARSLDSGYHSTRTWVTALHGRIRYEIPEGWRVVGENMYGQHSIRYERLPSYFLVFAIFDEHNVCLSWDDTAQWAELLGLDIVPTVYRGVWDEDVIRNLEVPPAFSEEPEGYVVRIADAFSYHDWYRFVGKSVRAGHVKENAGHWRSRNDIPANGLAGGS